MAVIRVQQPRTPAQATGTKHNPPAGWRHHSLTEHPYPNTAWSTHLCVPTQGLVKQRRRKCSQGSKWFPLFSGKRTGWRQETAGASQGLSLCCSLFYCHVLCYLLDADVQNTCYPQQQGLRARAQPRKEGAQLQEPLGWASDIHWHLGGPERCHQLG